MTSEQVAQRAVELAVAAAGVRDKDWTKRVYDNVAEITTMMTAESEIYEWAHRIAEAAKYRVNYLGFEEEVPTGWTRPSRLIISTQSDRAIKDAPGKPNHNPTGEEHLRTDPLWTRPGKLVAARIKEVQVGSELLVYKFTEQTDDERKVRVLVHFEVIRSPRAGGSAPPPARGTERQASESRPDPGTPPGEPPAGTAAPPEAHSPADNAALSEIERRFDALSGPNKVKYANVVRDAGVVHPTCPEPEHVELAMRTLTELETG